MNLPDRTVGTFNQVVKNLNLTTLTSQPGGFDQSTCVKGTLTAAKPAKVMFASSGAADAAAFLRLPLLLEATA